MNERHRHRYEVNNIYVPQLEAKGYKVSARTPSENLPEMMELPGHPFFIGRAVPPRVHLDAAPRPSAVQGIRQRGAAPPRRLQAPGVAATECASAASKSASTGRCSSSPGPDTLESEQLCLDVAGKLKELTAKLGMPFIFKGSYDKANRSSGKSYRGPGMDEGLRILSRGEAAVGVPGAHRRARRHDDEGGRGGRRRDPDAGVPLPPDQFHPRAAARPASR